MTDLAFAQPQFAHALWLVLGVTAALIYAELRSNSLLDRFIGKSMQARLVERPGDWRRGLRIALLSLSMISIVIAAMRPQWGFEFIESPQVGAEIMVALDVSRSMLAEDVAPNRLERAKAELRDLLPYLAGDQVGLIAFAGRASVLCPLTPDFGFLRVVLDNVDVGSVSRGGTRLEEPIRKATRGFGTSGDLSRVLLIFTDGEDHDSFPLDAARQAAERGVRIIVIGFGDENGSEIYISDPQTGARTRVTDSSGRPVISRLDGELLREIALETDGAYVPAGTGLLDLKSIFEAHIRPLMRATGESRGRTVQKDGFQWALLVALLALVASTFGRSTRRSIAPLLALGLGLAGAPEGWAQAPPPPPASPAPEISDGDDPSPSPALNRIEIPEDAREAYNIGLGALASGDLDEAERLLEAARQTSGADGEVRYRATYNLGWVEIERADGAMDSAPQEALTHLERSADWFREAIALRPTDTPSRRNLEIVLKRALILADSLAENEEGDLASRLDALIDEQRSAAASIRQLTEAIGRDPQAHLGEGSKPLFRATALAERKTLASANAIGRLAGDELNGLKNGGDQELSPEQRMRALQLESLLGYLHQARERIGQARSQLRRKQAVRAHKRASAGLSRLKRAREQLQNPVQILDGLMSDTVQVASETRALATASTGLLSAGTGAPAWLDSEYLAEDQDEIAERGAELDAKLTAGLEQSGEGLEPEQARLLEQLRAAQPYLAEATEELITGALALREQELVEASNAQARALTALAEAREQFLDLKGLIEVAHADEKRIASVLDEAKASPEYELAEFGPPLHDLQQRNLQRLQRMGEMVDEMEEQLAAAPPADEEAGNPEAERERLELAGGILALSESSMRGALDSLGRLGQEEEAAAPARESVNAALGGLDALRRLFFTVVEHLRDVANQQIELGDETETAPDLEDEVRGPEAQRLAVHQRGLADYTESLATALHEQSFADPADLASPGAPPDPAQADAMAEKFTQASELVILAAEDMLGAAGGLAKIPEEDEGGHAEGEHATHDETAGDREEDESEKPLLDRTEIRTLQDAAVQRVLDALAILEPPSQDPQDGNDGESQPQEEPQQQPGEGEPEGEPEPSEADSDPNQLLQSVRDREAERHRRNRERETSGYEPVDKDW